MIEVIEAKMMGWMGIPARPYLVDTQATPRRGQPVLHRFLNDNDYMWWGWRYIDKWDGKPTNNIIYPVIMICE